MHLISMCLCVLVCACDWGSSERASSLGGSMLKACHATASKRDWRTLGLSARRCCVPVFLRNRYLICTYMCVCDWESKQRALEQFKVGGKEQTCSVCACVTCALVCVVQTASCAERFEGWGKQFYIFLAVLMLVCVCVCEECLSHQADTF